MTYDEFKEWFFNTPFQIRNGRTGVWLSKKGLITNLERNGGVTMNDEYQEAKELFTNGALSKTEYFIYHSLKKMENGKQLFGGFPTGIYLMNDELHSGLTIKSDEFPNLECKLTIKYEMEVKELVEMTDKYEELIQISKEDLFDLLASYGSKNLIDEFAEKYEFTREEYNEWWENEG